jgi:hypothetical protein
MRTCKACGCYIPDLWGVCPGCGAIEAQKSDSVGRSAPDRYEVRGGRGNQILIQFPDPEKPTPAWTYRSTDDLETVSLLSRTITVTAPQAHLETELRLAGMGFGRFCDPDETCMTVGELLQSQFTRS